MGLARWTAPADPKNGAPPLLYTPPPAVAAQNGSVRPDVDANACSCLLAATTTSVPTTVGVTKRLALPVGNDWIVWPVAGSKARSVPPGSSGHTAPPATIAGPPVASDTHSGAKVAFAVSTVNARTGPPSHQMYNTGAAHASPPKLGQPVVPSNRWPPMPPRCAVLTRKPLPVFPAAKTRLSPRRIGPAEPRSRSAPLSAAQFGSAKESSSCSDGDTFTMLLP